MNRSITLRTQVLMNVATVLFIAAMLVVSQTFADEPEAPIAPASTLQGTTTTISYQGHLTSANGQPVNGNTNMTFKLYTVPTGGTAVWTETRSSTNAVPVTNGLFKVALGGVTPLDTALLNQPLWLGITAGSDAEMTPREQLGSVPYAAVAGAVPDGSVTSTKQTLTTYRADDRTAVRIQGQVASQTLSEFVFDNVPAGDAFIMVTLTARSERSSIPDGSVWLEVNGIDLSRTPTHTLVNEQYTQIALHRTFYGFAGGRFVVRVKALTEQPGANTMFGDMWGANDWRFGRSISMIAGF